MIFRSVADKSLYNIAIDYMSVFVFLIKRKCMIYLLKRYIFDYIINIILKNLYI